MFERNALDDSLKVRRRRRRLVTLLAALAFVGVASGKPLLETRSEKTTSTLRVGALLLHACLADAYCGELSRAVDPTGKVAGTVPVYFEFYPHRGIAKTGTLVATEGGPGYPATESRGEYLALFAPLRADHDIVIMDNRGTGKSGAIDCHELQMSSSWTVAAVAACGESLAEHAALYSTEYAADDLAAVLLQLEVRQIDLYGDSYGTYFAQDFAVRHPQMLRSIVLDGAYPLNGADYPWYPGYAPAMRDKFNIACARYAPCAALAGDSIEHIMPALAELRANPFLATGYDVDGRQRTFRADPAGLAIVMFGGAPALTTTREVDAAARAFAQGDKLPLVRLMAETYSAVDSRDPAADVTKWSAGLAAAVMCQDPPQIFDMRLAPDQRAADRDRALGERRRDHPDTYAPFTLDEFRAMPLDYSFLDMCVDWPVSPPEHPASTVGGSLSFPDIPALIISGELDDITPMADGAAVAAAFKRGIQIRVANSFHVNALPHARSPCAANIVRSFIETTLVGDTSCAAHIAPLRLVPRFARHARDLDPVTATHRNAANPAQLRVAAAALATAGDLLARVSANTSGHGEGLRGGTFRIEHGSAVHIFLDRVRWVDDVAVSGSIVGPTGRHGAVRATLRLSDTAGADGRLNMRWHERQEGASARIIGRLGGAQVAAQGPVP